MHLVSMTELLPAILCLQLPVIGVVWEIFNVIEGQNRHTQWQCALSLIHIVTMHKTSDDICNISWWDLPSSNNILLLVVWYSKYKFYSSMVKIYIMWDKVYWLQSILISSLVIFETAQRAIESTDINCVQE